MAYQTGNASSIPDLLDKLAEFAEVNHWVVDKLDSKAGTLFLHNSDGYWSFGQTTYSNFPVLAIAINDDFNPSLSWNAQTNSSAVNCKSTRYGSFYKGVGTNFHTFPFASYTFLGCEQYLHVIIRVDSRRYRHFGVGTLNKDGFYDGGLYAYGTFSVNEVSTECGAFPFLASINTNAMLGKGRDYPSVIRIENKDYIFGNSVAGASAMGCGDATVSRNKKLHPDNLLITASLSSFNNTITLVPMSIYAYLASKQYQRVGVVCDFYVARIDSVTPGSIQEINGQKFYCCPATMYQSTTSNVTDEDNSYDLGYFYRVIE